jgi:hypothetical protein
MEALKRVFLEDVITGSFLDEPGVLRLELARGTAYQPHWEGFIFEEAREAGTEIESIALKYDNDRDGWGQYLAAIEISVFGDSAPMDDLCARISLDHDEYQNWVSNQAPAENVIAVE